MKISFSRLARYQRCPEQYRQYYIGEGEDKAGWAAAGKAFHEAAEALELRGWDDVKFAERFLRAQIDDRIPTRRDRKRAHKFVEPFLQRRLVENEELGFRYYGGGAETGTEVELRYEFGGHVFVGYIDRLFYDSADRLVAGDYKTGREKPEHLVQMQCYIIAWNLTHDEKVSYAQLLYLSDGKTKTMKAPRAVPVMPKIDRHTFEDMLRQFIGAIESNYFPPLGAFTDACRTCFVRQTCRYAAFQEHSQVYISGGS